MTPLLTKARPTPAVHSLRCSSWPFRFPSSGYIAPGLLRIPAADVLCRKAKLCGWKPKGTRSQSCAQGLESAGRRGRKGACRRRSGEVAQARKDGAEGRRGGSGGRKESGGRVCLSFVSGLFASWGGKKDLARRTREHSEVCSFLSFCLLVCGGLTSGGGLEDLVCGFIVYRCRDIYSCPYR
ncbi:unnamed protein product [Tuber aestivum]|uniref:Uncharacterized protein n=1 Tax=Tuber aestivum TaxID=59557 RepID=A0A292PUT7_9PEZI|nr:unnamed protein product [Tuber aestivum]